MKKKGEKEKLKPLSFYGLDPKDVVRAFIQIDPEELKRLEDGERKFKSNADSKSEQIG